MADEEEVWKQIIGFEDYEVSNLGRLRSLKRGKIRILKLQTSTFGYQQASLYRDAAYVRFSVHKLVALAFLGPQPSKYHQVGHKDGVKANNKATNLKWCTNSENQLDRREHGTASGGRKGLTPEQVREIRASTDSCLSIAPKYGVNSKTISHIRTFRTHRDIQ